MGLYLGSATRLTQQIPTRGGRDGHHAAQCEGSLYAQEQRIEQQPSRMVLEERLRVPRVVAWQDVTIDKRQACLSSLIQHGNSPLNQ